MFCAKCGSKLPDNVKFCPGCGEAVNAKSNPWIQKKGEEGSSGSNHSSAMKSFSEASSGGTSSSSGSYSGGNCSTYTAGSSAASMNYSQNSSNGTGNYLEDSKDTNQIMAIVAYITMVGWIIAMAVTGNKRNRFVNFHLNQALVIWLFSFLGLVPVIGIFWSIFMLILGVLGLVSACEGSMKEVPLLGKIHILKESR